MRNALFETPVSFGDIRKLKLLFHVIYLPIHGQYTTYPFGSSSKVDIIPILRQVNAKDKIHVLAFMAVVMSKLKKKKIFYCRIYVNSHNWLPCISKNVLSCTWALNHNTSKIFRKFLHFIAKFDSK